MKYKFSAAVIILIILFSGCKTNPPNSPEEINDYGKVAVLSNIDGAAIFVDDVDSGFLTPDTLTLKVGEHVIGLAKEGYAGSPQTVTVEKDLLKEIEITLTEITTQKVVLLEDFANVSCIPCVQSNLLIESLLHGTFKGKLVVVKFPTDFPGPSDPFYLANESECADRISYYNVFYAPTLIVDGIKKPISSDSNAVKNDINERLAADAAFDIEINSNISGDDFAIDVTITPVNISGISVDNLTLHTIIMEEEIHYDDPPGANGETDFYNVMRKMLPSSEGTQLTGLIEGEGKDFSFNFSLAGKPWDRTKLAVVAFIQDRLTKEVFQAAKSE